ncbi:hypothetical protein RhiirA4_482600 [Rhizophagus irregularis]|uniref:Uncharacterized protein n=1 Tax=Rhizophagus irregularis TaxID=588596 RepID=A0A2I1HL94_9GLOM|nr:hypothetical protein RhiirA4_482600 [Rhizophagus irregularis]
MKLVFTIHSTSVVAVLKKNCVTPMRDGETWFQGIQRIKKLLKVAPGILSTLAPGVAFPNDDSHNYI